VPSHLFVPDPEIFPQLEGLKLEADDELIYVFAIDADTATDDSKHPMVSILITDAFIGEEVNPEKKHHQAYTPMGEKKPGVVYKKKYRKAEDRIQPIVTQLPEESCIVHNIIENMPVLPTHPPDFVPGLRYTQERYEKLQLNPDGFLWPEEEKLAHHLVREQEECLSWIEEEKGEFWQDFFPPVRIPTVPHTPWVYKNIPIPPGPHDKLVKIICDKIVSGVYEPSNAAYRSRWFCVIQQDGSSLHVVHDLRLFNAVTIGDASVPPITEELVELFGACACYASLDLFVAYDQRIVHPESQDPTMFQSPLGTLRHTHLVIGHTNSVQIMQGDINYILRDKIPLFTLPFIDDVAVKGPVTHYENTDGTYETIPENSGIRRFVWEHLANVNQILQWLKYVGGTFSGKKLELCVPTIVILGQRCNYEGRVPHEAKMQKIQDWPIPIDVTGVHGFLGTCRLIQIFTKDFAKHACPLVNLTCKDITFHFGAEEIAAMENIKDLVTRSPALRPLNYTAHDWPIILAIDSSVTAIRYVLMQVRDDKRRYPSRFGSIAWTEHESRYSQAKLKLYGLFRVLHAYRIYIIGVENLVVEVDAKYLKGMLNNPDIQPNATINRWIAGILLFNFKLVRVPAIHHTAADGLSHRLPAPEDLPETDDSEEWIDDSYGFFMELANWQPPHLFPSTLTMRPLFTQIIRPSAVSASASDTAASTSA
jgi:hypothetical protein